MTKERAVANEAMPDLLPLPRSSNLPRTRSSRFTRWVARSVLRVFGWRMVGTFPDLPKGVLIGAPHSSNWDGLWALLVKVALGVEVRIFAKHQLFWWPLGPLRQLPLAAFAADGRALILTEAEGVYLLDAQTGQPLATPFLPGAGTVTGTATATPS